MNYKLTLIMLCIPVFTMAQVSNVALYNIIKEVSSDLKADYIDSSTGVKMADYITSKYKSHGYDTTMNIEEICCAITSDLRQASNDKLIGVEAPDTVQLKKIDKDEDEAEKESHVDNFYYGTIKLVNNTIGYLAIDAFTTNEKSFEINLHKRLPLVKVMSFLKPCNALVIDLRNCKIGNAEMLLRFLSCFMDTGAYVFSEEERKSAKHRTDFYMIDDYKFTDFRNKKIYVLTSHGTMGYGELVAYILRKDCGATIIGERTAGVGHISYYYTGKYCNVIVPALRLQDKTNKNYTWQESGITPDIACNSDSAYYFVLSRVLNEPVSKVNATLPEVFFNKPLVTSYPLTMAELKQYCGTYMRATIRLKENTLYYSCLVCMEEPLQYIKNDTFETPQGVTLFFKRDARNNVNRIYFKYKTGLIESYRLTEKL